MKINRNLYNYHRNDMRFKGQISNMQVNFLLKERPELADVFHQIKTQTPKGIKTVISELAGKILLVPMKHPSARAEMVGNSTEVMVQDSTDVFRNQAKQYLKQFRAPDGRFSTYDNYMKKINS
ncbi:MAG: hypothetical protein PHC34_13415 [Candidatus Gastranaerophilales bacterium]|nr:hypothetical protein [Candidatus Gastranaerophilales bacterium]